METLFETYRNLLKSTSLQFLRSIEANIDWNKRLIGIIGARGIGKTTLLLQHIKRIDLRDESELYVSLDNIWFTENKLIHLADKFVKQGGTRIYIDEVHKYPNWSQEIKNMYDNFPELKIVFTGSSLLEILNARADLSRRALVYNMQGLSFREFLEFELNLKLPAFTFEEIIENHIHATEIILKKIKPLKHFNNYLKYGYYPFHKDFGAMYHYQLQSIINMIIELELPLLRAVDIAYTVKIKQLLYIIAQSVPFIPNISKLSQKIGINRQTLLAYIHYLQEAGLTRNLLKDTKGISLLQKPEKIFLENTNLSYALASNNVNTGNLRETFFLNQLSFKHQVSYPNKADFLVDDKYLFEIGGEKKSTKLIADRYSFYIASDEIEYGFKNKIPLWLFGFLY